MRALEPGVHGLSNTHLDGTLWPKVTTGTHALQNIIRTDYSPDDLMKLLADDRVPSDDKLPKRGNDLAFERRVAPIFIRGEEYGTRACSAVTIGTTQIPLHRTDLRPQRRCDGASRDNAADRLNV